jgi:anthranilate synthase component I
MSQPAATQHSPLSGLHVPLQTHYTTLAADTNTPVSLYLQLRDRYPGAVLLECTDFHAADNHFSFLALEPIASFRVEQGLLEVEAPGLTCTEAAGWARPLVEQLGDFQRAFQVEAPPSVRRFSAFFGHTAFEAVQHFESLVPDPAKARGEVPDMHYRFFRFVLAFDHFRDTLTVLEHCPQGQSSRLEELTEALRRPIPEAFPFALLGPEEAGISDEDFMELVEKAKAHCRRGDVFQLVLSRRFRQAYRGDEFSVYRRLRSVNPSPYLFFFDFGDYRLFGSSPEAQLVVRDGLAQIHPIAGTYHRSGDDQADADAALRLAEDPKENAEHVMLVDLARNDLSRHGRAVRVAAYRELQYFSHVIHLVSRVEGRLDDGVNPLQVFADTFPAGTLSGAPKFRALELIDAYEPQARGFYGGAIGLLGLDGSLNHAIAIRTFLARDGYLHYQAGAGVVVHSDPRSELSEVGHKLGALRRAMQLACSQTNAQSSQQPKQ